MRKKYWINRFPICALVYREAAEKIGYDEEEAKSLGLTRAIFFAAAKNGFGGAGAKGRRYKGENYEHKQYMQQKALRGYDADSIEILNFAGLGSYVIHKEDGSVRGFIGGKPIEPENFNSSVKEKCILNGQERGYRKLRKFIQTRLGDLKDFELNSAAIYKIYKSIRDEVRRMEFLDEEENNVGLSASANVNTA